jgi:hypothetical protein
MNKKQKNAMKNFESKIICWKKNAAIQVEWEDGCVFQVIFQTLHPAVKRSS